MKKFLCLALALTTCFSLAACGNESKPQDDISSSNLNQTENNEESNKNNNTDVNSDLPGVLSFNSKGSCMVRYDSPEADDEVLWQLLVLNFGV